MKILIVGVSGFIGKNFIESYSGEDELYGIYNSSTDIEDFVDKKNIKIKLFKCDLTNPGNTKKLSETIGSIDKCIFLVSNTDIPRSKIEPSYDFKITTFSLVNFLTYFKVDKFVYMSTAGVYDGLSGELNVEDEVNPTYPYCISKLTAEYYVKFFYQVKTIKEYVILRFGGAFGKYCKPNKFVSKLINDISNGQNEIHIYGDGQNFVNVMYAKDVVNALNVVLNSNITNLICNLGAENLTITEIVKKTAQTLQKHVDIVYTPKKANQKYMGFKFTSDFDEKFNFKRSYSFEGAVKDFVKLS